MQGSKSKHLLELENGIFENILYEVSVDELIHKKYLSQYLIKNFTKKEVKDQLKKVHKVAGEFKLDELNIVMSSDDVLNFVAYILKDIIEKEKRHHILGFCVCVEHAQKSCEIFNKFNLNADYLCGSMSLDERELKLKDFKDGKINILLNVEILTTGYDAPYIDCILLMRPTKSLALHQQMIGRGFRIDTSKENTLYVDFSGNIENFKFSSENQKFLQCPHCNICYFEEIDNCKSCGYQFFQYCHKCKSKNEIEREICKKCHAKLKKTCPKCKTVNFGDNKICKNKNCQFNFYKTCPKCNSKQEQDKIKCNECNYFFFKKCPNCFSYTSNENEICEHCKYNFYDICPTCNEKKLEINEYCRCGERFKRCQKCKRQMLFKNKICSHCQTLQKINEYVEKTCPHCDEIISKTAVFCPNCKGFLLKLKMPFASICDTAKLKEKELEKNKLNDILKELKQRNANLKESGKIEYVLMINCQKRISSQGNYMLSLCYHCLNNKRYTSNVNLAIPKADYFSKIWLKNRFPDAIYTQILNKLNNLRTKKDNNTAAEIIIDKLLNIMAKYMLNRPEFIKIKQQGYFIKVEELNDKTCKDKYLINE